MLKNLDRWLIWGGIAILVGWIISEIFGGYVATRFTGYSSPIDYFLQGLWTCIVMFFTSYNGVAILMAGLVIREIRAGRGAAVPNSSRTDSSPKQVSPNPSQPK